MARTRGLLIGGVVGAAAVYLLDPELGEARRARLGEALVGWLLGAAADGDAPLPREGDDLSVLSRVESVLLATPGFPRGDVDVEVVDGACVLRGQVASDELGRRIAEAAAAVPGVEAVESLLQAGS